MKEKLPLSFKLTAKRLFFRLSGFYTKAFPRSKFAEQIAQSAYEHGLSLNGSPKNDKTLPEIAVFDQLIPTPDRDAGSARMSFILQALAQWSRPVFIPLGKRLWPKYEEQLWNEGIETGSILRYRQYSTTKFKAVVLSRPAVADALLKPIRGIAPGLKIVYDMLDVHHLRAEREAALTRSATPPTKRRRCASLKRGPRAVRI